MESTIKMKIAHHFIQEESPSSMQPTRRQSICWKYLPEPQPAFSLPPHQAAGKQILTLILKKKKMQFSTILPLKTNTESQSFSIRWINLMQVKKWWNGARSTWFSWPTVVTWGNGYCQRDVIRWILSTSFITLNECPTALKMTWKAWKHNFNRVPYYNICIIISSYKKAK